LRVVSTSSEFPFVSSISLEYCVTTPDGCLVSLTLIFAKLSSRLLTFFYRGYPTSQYLLSIGAGSEPFTGRVSSGWNWSIADRREDRVLSSRHPHIRSLSISVCMGGSVSDGSMCKAFCKYFEFSFSFFYSTWWKRPEIVHTFCKYLAHQVFFRSDISLDWIP
jgi:hypothetical protein